eukprot:361744-Chlamydomonas_euryale.AAC.2
MEEGEAWSSFPRIAMAQVPGRLPVKELPVRRLGGLAPIAATSMPVKTLTAACGPAACWAIGRHQTGTLEPVRCVWPLFPASRPHTSSWCEHRREMWGVAFTCGRLCAVQEPARQVQSMA